jgi:alkylation response protein AidB-like acyl-CoA dehydrogenase
VPGAVVTPDDAGTQADHVDLIVRQVRRFLDQKVRPSEIDREGRIPAELREGLGALGLFGLTIPVEYGGVGLPLRDACRVVSELARVERSIAIMVGLHVGLGTRGLVAHGGSELKREWLPRLASGECVASFSVTEASAGSDLTAIRTTGEPVSGGLCVTGEKSYVTNGGFAGLFTVLVRSPGVGGERGTTMVCIPRDAEGVQVGPEEDKLGIRGSSTVPVSFDRVVVPWSHVLGEAGRGMDVTHELLGWGRTLMSAGCVGTARAALEAATAYVGARRQFGRAIGTFGATQVHVAWMAGRVHAMQAIVESVAEDHASGGSLETSSAIAKVFTSESAFEVCDRAVQLHGALGFLEPTGVARMLRDARITRIFEGANDVLLVRLGAARLASSACSLRSDDVDSVGALARRVDDTVVEVRARLGIRAVRHQLVLQRIAAAEIAMTVARAAARSPGVVARHAAKQLVDEGHRALDALTHAVQDERDAAAVAAIFAEA